MSRLLGALTLLAAVALGCAVLPSVILPARTGLRVPAALVTGEGLEGLRPHRGASRDRALRGKARRRARRQGRQGRP